MKKILSVNWRWYNTGGDWTYIEQVNNTYSNNGFNVIPFSVQDEQNYTNKDYFISKLEINQLNENKSLKNGALVFKKVIKNKEAANNLKELLKTNKFEFAHIHSIIHSITPVILPILKANNIPVLWTLHDYSLICPDIHFFRNGQICEKCKSRKFYNAIRYKCKKNSYLASSISTISHYYFYFSNYIKYVDYFLCPSVFLKNKFIEFGYPSKKLIVTNYCYNFENLHKIKNGTLLKHKYNLTDNYALYVGRLEKIKGVQTLIEAFSELREIHLVIVGDGKYKKYIEELINIKGMNNIHLLGKLGKQDVLQIIKLSSFVLVPSLWYENFPFSIIESMLLGKAVIGSKIGGIPELIENGYNGFLFDAGDVESLKKYIKIMISDERLRIQLGINAQDRMKRIVDTKKHLELIINLIKNIK